MIGTFDPSLSKGRKHNNLSSYFQEELADYPPTPFYPLAFVVLLTLIIHIDEWVDFKHLYNKYLPLKLSLIDIFFPSDVFCSGLKSSGKKKVLKIYEIKTNILTFILKKQFLIQVHTFLLISPCLTQEDFFLLLPNLGH